MMFDKILMAYDGSREGRVALEGCEGLARLTGAEVHLLAVLPLQTGLFLAEGVMPGEVLDEDRRRFQAVLDEGVAALAARGFQAQGHLRSGEPVEEIAELARELGATLIVLGHRQQRGFAARWWKGSIGATLLDRAPCSVLIVLERGKG